MYIIKPLNRIIKLHFGALMYIFVSIKKDDVFHIILYSFYNVCRNFKNISISSLVPIVTLR